MFGLIFLRNYLSNKVALCFLGSIATLLFTTTLTNLFTFWPHHRLSSEKLRWGWEQFLGLIKKLGPRKSLRENHFLLIASRTKPGNHF
jgi:hypothetical protein